MAAETWEEYAKRLTKLLERAADRLDDLADRDYNDPLSKEINQTIQRK